MNWTEITAKVPTDKTDQAAAIANMTVPYGIYIEDYTNLEADAQEIAHIDLIDQELVSKDRTHSIIHMYIAESDNAVEAASYLRERFSSCGIENEINCVLVDDADWNENWKKYFHTTEIGEKLCIVPSWESYDNKNGRVVLNIDPGAAFGTGTHATTSLCLSLLESHIKNGTKMLDIGTGSGILAIASSLLGAETAIGVDIDAQSVKTAKENAEINNVQNKCEFIVGDLADKISGKYDVICANIVADVIIKLFDNVKDFMTDDGVLIISGIIDIRKDDVLNSAAAHGFKIAEENYKDNWCAFTLTK